MIAELWWFFRKKWRKENGLRRLSPAHIWWALAYAWDHFKWMRMGRP
ncbi:hypothetical protein ABZ960_20555 [Streptomyces pseudovenezuelae]